MDRRFGRRVAASHMAVFALVAATAVAGCGSSSKSHSTSAASGTSTPSGGSSGTPLPLRIAYSPNPTNTTILVAQQQGFFKKNGLDVKLTSTQGSAALLPSIGKQFDLVIETPATVLQGIARGFKTTMVSSETIENATSLRNSYLIGGKGITSIQQLKGKTIGVPTESGNIFEGVIVMLHKAGISKSQVKFLLVPFSNLNDGLQKGTIQAALTIIPFQGQMLGEGLKDLGNPVMSALNNKPGLSVGWAGSQPWVQSHQATVAAFNKSQAEALAWMKTHVAGAQKILVKDFQLPASVAAKFPVTQYVSLAIKPAYLTQWIAPMKSVGDLPASFNPPASQLTYTP